MRKHKSVGIWYNNPTIITNSIIILIIAIMVLSQSFVINDISIVRDIINHNMNYILILLYFILLKTRIGKRYFNYLNIFIVVLYSIFTIASFLSIFHVINLIGILSLAIKFILLIYLIKTMFRNTSYWEELHLSKSLINELDNEWYFYALSVLSVILLATNMVLVTNISGAILTILDSCYIIFMARYVYLYGEYMNFKEISKTKKMKVLKEEVNE